MKSTRSGVVRTGQGSREAPLGSALLRAQSGTTALRGGPTGMGSTLKDYKAAILEARPLLGP